MGRNNSKHTLAMAVAAITLTTMGLAGALQAAPFTPGNVVVFRSGDGSAGLSGIAAAAFLDERSAADGTLVQSIALPTAASAPHLACTTVGSASNDGSLTLSTDGQYLVGPCYNAAPGTSGLAATSAATVQRVVFRVGVGGVVDTTTSTNAQFSASNMRAVASDDGSRYWALGGNSGVALISHGATSGTLISTTVVNNRAIGIADGQLYASNASGSNTRIKSVGAGLPTTLEAMADLPGLPTTGTSGNQFYFADLNAGVAGVDTVYLADDGTGGIRKFSLVGGSWVLDGVIDSGAYRGLTGSTAAGVVTLYATKTGTLLVTVTDTAGYNTAPSSTAVTTLATAGANTAFRGVAFVPSSAATPVLTLGNASALVEGNPGCNAGTNMLVYPVTATPAPSGSLNFNASITGGTADGADVGALVTVAVTGGVGSVQVPVVCDLLSEDDETVAVTLQAGAGYTLGAMVSASGTITNDDVEHVVVNDVSVTESVGTMNFTVSLQGGVLAGTGGVSVTYATSNGSTGTPAVAPGDYTATSGVVNIPAGSNSAQVGVIIIDDTDPEGDETLDLNLTGQTGASSIADNLGIGTILANDPLFPTISIASVSVTEGDSGTSNATFSVSIDQAPSGADVVVGYATADGTALQPGDYLSTSGQLTFPIGATTPQSILVPIVGDCSIETPAVETFTVNLSLVSGTAAVQPTGTGSITDNDVAISASIAVAPESAAEGNTGANTRSVTVTLDRAMQCGAFTYSITTAGTATSGTDYQPFTVSGATLSGMTTTATHPLTVIGDIENEADETIVLNLSGSGSNVSLATAQATATLTNDDPVPITIEQIQGSGHTSPVVDTVVSTSGIVTAVLPAPNGGFMLQMPDALASPDPATSNGVFVFTGGTPSVSVGDEVRVRGTVIEFNTSATATPDLRVTEFTNSGLVFQIVSSGNPLPAPIVLDANRPSPNPATPSCGVGLGNFECIESMRVTTSTGMVNLGNQFFASDPIAELWITTSGQRAYREGGLLPSKVGETPPSLTPPAPPLPITYQFDLNPEVFELDMDRAGLPNTVVPPGTSFSATGVLTQEFGQFELFPTSFTVNTPGPVLPAPVPAAGPLQITIASQNLHLLFDDVNDPWNATDCGLTTPDPDFCPSTERWNAKLNLLSRQIREQLRTPMVIGVQEVEKQGALDALAIKINADIGAGGPQYAAVVGPIDDLDGGHQNVGFLIRNDVNVQSIVQLNTTQTWIFNGTDQGEIMDRPPLLLRASKLVGGEPFHFAVMVLHQRSLSGIDTLTPSASLINAHRVRQKRLYQAALTAQAIQQFRSEHPDLPFYVLGDLNAFPQSDGYADVTGIIKGTADPALSQYNLSFFNLQGSGPNGNIVDPPLTGASELAPFGERYSYQFNDTPQQIDHAFMNAAGLARFSDIVFARNNVDLPEQFLIRFGNTLGTENPLVSSDHDGFVLYIDARPDALFRNGFED